VWLRRFDNNYGPMIWILGLAYSSGSCVMWWRLGGYGWWILILAAVLIGLAVMSYRQQIESARYVKTDHD
jgi:hypothetical protein